MGDYEAILKNKARAGPVAEWLSTRALRPRVSPVGILGVWHCSSGHAEVASHIAQPEALTTRIYNYVLGVEEALGRRRRRKKEDWQQMLARVPIFKEKRNRYKLQNQNIS